MKWDIIRASNALGFITTDSPVSFYNREITPPLEAGLIHVGTRVLFPINHEFMLIMRHPEYIIDSGKSPLEEISEPISVSESIEITFYPEPISNDDLNQYNWLLSELADRIIAGKCREILEKCLVTPPTI